MIAFCKIVYAWAAQISTFYVAVGIGAFPLDPSHAVANGTSDSQR